MEVDAMMSRKKFLSVWLVSLFVTSVVLVGVSGSVGAVPPATPKTPIGPTEGDINVNYTFRIGSVPDNNPSLRFQFDWGDGSALVWKTLPYQTHSWTQYGQYQVRARVHNASSGETSGWSNALLIQINPLSITGIAGGTSVTISIKNSYNISKLVDYRVELIGGTFPGFHINKIYDSSVDENDTLEPVLIKPGSTESITVKPMMALGQFKIEVTVKCSGYSSKITKTYNALILFFYVFIR